VAVVARLFGLCWVNACRVVYVVDEGGPVQRFGFAYGTLPDHAASGEERFLVEWDREGGGVWYDILAFSRPRHVLARLGYPWVRRVQRRFGRDSAAAMARALGNSPAGRRADSPRSPADAGDVPAWYDQLSEKGRWDVQARFWRAVAGRCAASPAVFCYDLMNEPVVPGGKGKDWLGPPFGCKHFVQFVTLDQQDRPRPAIARQWVHHQATAI
jgi:hypothetical protein